MTGAEIISRLKDAVRRERHSTAEVIENLAAFDERKLWRDQGYPHLFAYCREALGYSESAAGKRIFACRAAQKHRRIFAMLREGTLHLEGVILLATSLTPQNREELLAQAAKKSAREIQKIVTAVRPVSPRADVIRQAAMDPPQSSASPQSSSPSSPPAAAPALAFHQRIELAALNRSRVSFDADDQVVALIERAREVLRHKYPFAGIADIVKEALESLLEERDPERELKLDAPGRTKRPPSAGSAASAPPSTQADNRRRIPRWVRKAVWKRDQGRCAFVSEEGRRCGTRGWLEYDHVVPFAKGGRSDEPENIRLLCRHHNQLMAERHFAARAPQELPWR